MQWIICVLVAATIVFKSDCAEYCYGNTFEAKCNDSQVILMQTANYGRMYAENCIKGEPETLGCFGNVISDFDQACTGKDECSLSVFKKIDDKVLGCYKGSHLRFLDAEYECITVQNSTGCGNKTLTLDNSRGYLPGVWLPSKTHTGKTPGTGSCPWKLAAQPGQRFKIDVLDVSLISSLPTTWANGVCPIRLGVSDPRDTIEQDLCETRYDRQTTVYTSTSHQIQLHVILDDTLAEIQQQVYYLLYYQVIGCAEMRPPVNTWSLRDGDRMTVYCNQTGETWYLVCKDSQWLGFLGNCSRPRGTTGPPSLAEGQDAAGFNWSIVVAVIIGIAIGVVVGLSLLGVVIVILKCRDKRKASKPAARPDLSKIDVPYSTQSQQSLYDSGPSTSTYSGRRPAAPPGGHHPALGRSSSYHPPHRAGHPQGGMHRAASYHNPIGPHPRPLPNPHDPHYHVYGYGQQHPPPPGHPPAQPPQTGGHYNRSRMRSTGDTGTPSSSTTLTELDEHIYETAYATRNSVLGIATISKASIGGSDEVIGGTGSTGNLSVTNSNNMLHQQQQEQEEEERKKKEEEEREKEKRQKSLAKEYYEMRETPHSTLEREEDTKQLTKY